MRSNNSKASIGQKQRGKSAKVTFKQEMNYQEWLRHKDAERRLKRKLIQQA